MAWSLTRAKVLILVGIFLSTTAVAVMTNRLSAIVALDTQAIRPSITLEVEGLPENVTAGDLLFVVATLHNNANRPTPAVLRFEVRNGDGIEFDEVTVYAACGAEERVSSKTLIYYLGDHGPLLAPNGTSIPTGTTVAALEAQLGDVPYWPAVLREIATRDPHGYASLVDPGSNASAGPRASASEALKVLYYYGMVTAGDEASPNAADWTLTSPFADTWVVPGEGGTAGFIAEFGLDAQGSYNLKLWAERPDGLGVPNHPWGCQPL